MGRNPVVHGGGQLRFRLKLRNAPLYACLVFLLATPVAWTSAVPRGNSTNKDSRLSREVTPTCPTLTRLASTIGSVGLSRSNNCRASAPAGPPSRISPATEESLSRSSAVIL